MPLLVTMFFITLLRELILEKLSESIRNTNCNFKVASANFKKWQMLTLKSGHQFWWGQTYLSSITTLPINSKSYQTGHLLWSISLRPKVALAFQQ